MPTTGGAPTVLTSFNDTNGGTPIAGLTLSGSTLYGTTQVGGAHRYGEVFSLPVTGGTPTVLASFNSTNGQNPNAGLTLSGNTLYGTTMSGGAKGYGTVYSLTPNASSAPEPSAWAALSFSGLSLGGLLLQARRRAGPRA